jgi:hypothetical protein
MKKLVYLVVSLFFTNLATAQNDGFYKKTKVVNISGETTVGFVPTSISQASVGDTLYKMGKITNATGDEMTGWIPYVVPNNNVVINVEKTDGDKYEFDKNKDFNLRKKEMAYGHDERMRDKDVDIVKAKADGGRWQKRERIVVITNGAGGYSGYNTPYYPGSGSYSPTFYGPYIPTGNQTGYTVVHKPF